MLNVGDMPLKFPLLIVWIGLTAFLPQYIFFSVLPQIVLNVNFLNKCDSHLPVKYKCR